MWKVEKIVKKGDYLYAVVPLHPKRTKNNYVLMHRVVMENHLGRLLDTNEVVHHKDGNKHNNDISNLEVLTSQEHSRLHGRSTPRKISVLRCPQCRKTFERYENLTAGRKYGVFCSPSCRGKFSRYAQLHGITAEMEDAISVNIQRVYYGKLPDNTEET